MRSPTLPPMRMKAADTSASRAIADCTPLTVVSRSWTTAEIDKFISDVSTTSTNIAIASSRARRSDVPSSAIGGVCLTHGESPGHADRLVAGDGAHDLVGAGRDLGQVDPPGAAGRDPDLDVEVPD